MRVFKDTSRILVKILRELLEGRSSKDYIGLQGEGGGLGSLKKDYVILNDGPLLNCAHLTLEHCLV